MIDVFPLYNGIYDYNYVCKDWGWHRDWLEIIDEGAEVAEIYALLLIKSGEI